MSEELRFKMVDCEATILREIALPEMKQRDVAQTYRLIMESDEAVNWDNINRAIMERWSWSGLMLVKVMAQSGKCFATARNTGAER